MPTHLGELAARQNAANARALADVTALLLLTIMCLVNLELILLSPMFAEAVALSGQY